MHACEATDCHIVHDNASTFMQQVNGDERGFMRCASTAIVAARGQQPGNVVATA